MIKTKALILWLILCLVTISIVFPVDMRREVDIRRAVDERHAIDERNPIDVRYGFDVDLFDRQIHQRFGSFVGDVYTISIKSEGDINANIIIDGRTFDLKPILLDASIGSAIILTTMILPIVTPVAGSATQSAFAIFATKVGAGVANVAIRSLSLSAIQAGINGVRECIASDANFQKTMYATLEGAGNGFKWGAIVAGGINAAQSAIFVMQHGAEFVVTAEKELIRLDEIPGLDVNRNSYLVGQHHPDTNVPFVKKIVPTETGLRSGVFPKFDSIFDMRLDASEWMATDKVQFNSATKTLANAINKDLALKNQFSSSQIEQIMEGLTPDNFTWHHNEEIGLMQLVESRIHQATGHTGGKSLWGGGASYR